MKTSRKSINQFFKNPFLWRLILIVGVLITFVAGSVYLEIRIVKELSKENNSLKLLKAQLADSANIELIETNVYLIDSIASNSQLPQEIYQSKILKDLLVIIEDNKLSLSHTEFQRAEDDKQLKVNLRLTGKYEDFKKLLERLSKLTYVTSVDNVLMLNQRNRKQKIETSITIHHKVAK